MARSAAERADATARALDSFLRHHTLLPPRAMTESADAQDAGSFVAATPPRPDALNQALAGTMAGTMARLNAAAPPQPVHTDWLGHTMTVRGPAPDIDAFKRAAAGAGVIPWALDAVRMEEDFFHLLVATPNRSLSLTGARILAEQLRDAVERRHALASAAVGRSRACPFDLHSLCPVPASLLRLGPDDRHAVDWLWQNWGTTEPLRHVAHRPGTGQPAGWSVTFWSADWTPWQAILDLRARWPTLELDVQPQYGWT